MRVWMLAPTIRPDADAVFAHWRLAGYRVAALVNGDAPAPNHCDRLVRIDRYEGYARSINRLWREVAGEADIIVPGSDDLYPCETRFRQELAADLMRRFPGGFGVMHLGRHDLSQGASTDHCWIGAEYARRINGGNGPYWPEYFHFFDDTEAGKVAEKLGALWRRPEHGQRHAHWSLSASTPPAHLSRAQSQWATSRDLFEQRQAAGFPGHEPLP